MKYIYLFSFILTFLCTSCKENIGSSLFNSSSVDYNNLSALDENENLNAIIEIPAGTNKKFEFNKETKKFEIDQKEGKDRIINFLPYPGNYGYIPSTLMDKEKGGDGDAIDVLVLSESQPTGTLIAARAIATLVLYDEGEMDTKIIAIPVDSSLQIIPAKDFQDFMIEYDATRRMIEDWFMNYDGQNTTKLGGWKDANFAMKEVEKWKLVKEEN